VAVSQNRSESTALSPGYSCERVRFPAPDLALGVDDVIDWDSEQVTSVAAHVQALAGHDEVAIVARLFAWVRDEIAFDMAPDVQSRSSWAASNTIERRWGFCQQKAIALVALCRASGIPAVLVYQSVIDARMPDSFEKYLPGKRMDPHGLAAVHVGGCWQRLDPTIHREMSRRAGLRNVEWRPGSDALLPETDVHGDPHCSIEYEHEVSITLPEWVVDATLQLPFLHDPDFLSIAARHGERVSKLPRRSD
jgi:transglutaminase-like putative cysteine protease